jgi:hypothetical protein
LALRRFGGRLLGRPKAPLSVALHLSGHDVIVEDVTIDGNKSGNYGDGGPWAKRGEELGQTERALSRIDDGSYGVCESCGNPIGKMRAMAFPRATLCLTCKQREERR